MSGRALATLIALILAGLWGAGLGFAHWRGNLGFLDRVEATMTDLRTLARGTAKPPELMTIVAIDDETVRVEGSYPLSRATLARLVDTIARFEPKAIALDLLLVDPGAKDDDAALARSLSRSASVIAAAAVYPGGRQWAVAEGEGPLARVPDAERFLLAPEGVLGCRRRRRRQRGDRPDGNAPIRAVAVSGRRSAGSVLLLARRRPGSGRGTGNCARSSVAGQPPGQDGHRSHPAADILRPARHDPHDQRRDGAGGPTRSAASFGTELS